MIESKILLAEEVPNNNSVFGDRNFYLPAIIVDVNGIRTRAMFTFDQIREAEIRAMRCPRNESVKSWLDHIFVFLTSEDS